MPERKEKEKKEATTPETIFLEEQCGNDAELCAFLCHTLFVDPTQGISKGDLAILIEEAEENVKSENYRNAFPKYRQALDKAIFEAAQNPEEKSRYIKVIQNLAPKTAKVIEKVKERAEAEGLAKRAQQLEKEIRNYEFLSRRLEDVIRIASLYYNDRLEKLGEAEKQAVAEREIKEREKEA